MGRGRSDLAGMDEQRLSGMLPFNGQLSSETVESQPGWTMVVGSPTTNVYGIGESTYMSTNTLEPNIWCRGVWYSTGMLNAM